jgi:hypothetical protein
MDLGIKAVSISTRIRGIFPNGKYSGRVAGVYTSAANFSFGKYLITLADKTQGNLSYGMLCDLSGIDLKTIINSGDPAQIDADSLRAGNGSFEILFQVASVWSPEFRMLIEKKDIPFILANAGTIEQKLTQNKKMAGLAPLICTIPQILANIPADEMRFSILEHTAYNSLRMMINAIRSQDENALESAIKSLIGLGIGLTPSGDDILTGLFGTLAITMKADKNWILNIYKKAISQMAGQTTDVSLNYLTATGDGYYPERFSNLVATIIRSKDAKELDTPLKEMLRWGSTSGSEIVLGMLLGFYLAVESLN